MGGSEIIFQDFRPKHYVSKTRTNRLNSLLIRPWDVLLSRSGTVGNVALAPPAWSSYALTEHVLRLRFAEPFLAGFAACFLRSKWGRTQTVGSQYGSVISHIEPEHLERVLVPMLDESTVKAIGEAFCQAAIDREEANRLLREAEGMFAKVLGLPEQVPTTHSSVSLVQLSDLAGRFDGNYHSPSARSALATLDHHKVRLTTIKEFAGEGSVRAVTKFRERTFAKQGLPFVSSKEVLQIDPINLDRLAVNAHLNDMPEIGLSRGMIAVSCSGTLGRVIQIPGYMDGWAGTQHFIRIVPPTLEESAFLTAWLGSVYGQTILTRFAYGSVIRHIDRWMLESMPVPELSDQARATISEKAIRSLELREHAWSLEQKALTLLSAAIKGD